MPGVNSRNFHCILNKFRDLYEVSQASLEELCQALGSTVHAKQLHDFLHKEQTVEQEAKKALNEKRTKTRGKTPANRGKGVKRKK